MEPVSLVASIITITSVGGTVGKALRRVIALKNAPDILLALNNEIADLQFVVQDVAELFQRHGDSMQGPRINSLCAALEKTRSSLTILETMVTYKLIAIRGKQNEASLDRSVWLRLEPKVHKLMDEVGSCKTDLALALNIFNA